jgi:hypothetical protein
MNSCQGVFGRCSMLAFLQAPEAHNAKCAHSLLPAAPMQGLSLQHVKRCTKGQVSQARANCGGAATTSLTAVRRMCTCALPQPPKPTCWGSHATQPLTHDCDALVAASPCSCLLPTHSCICRGIQAVATRGPGEGCANCCYEPRSLLSRLKRRANSLRGSLSIPEAAWGIARRLSPSIVSDVASARPVAMVEHRSCCAARTWQKLEPGNSRLDSS